MSSKLSDVEYYNLSIECFRDIKLLEGPVALSSSLRRHKRLVDWLKSYQKGVLNDVETDLDLFTK